MSARCTLPVDQCTGAGAARYGFISPSLAFARRTLKRARNKDRLHILAYALVLTCLATHVHAQKAAILITEGSGGFTGRLDEGDRFGDAIEAIDDLDGDGVNDLVVGAPGDDDGGTDYGAVWILFMNADGTVRDQKKIVASDLGSDFLTSEYELGGQMASLGRLDSTGEQVIAVGTTRRIFLLFVRPDGTLSRSTVIDDESYVDTPYTVQALGDLDQNGVPDLAIPAGLADRRGFRLLLLEPDYTIKTTVIIAPGVGGFNAPNATLHRSLSRIGDINGDGTPDLAATMGVDDSGNAVLNGIWILHLNANGFGALADEDPILSWSRIDESTGMHKEFCCVGRPVNLGDLDRNGTDDFALTNHEAWIFYLDAESTLIGEQVLRAEIPAIQALQIRRRSFTGALTRIETPGGTGVPGLAMRVRCSNGEYCVMLYFGLSDLAPGVRQIRPAQLEGVPQSTRPFGIQATIVGAGQFSAELFFRPGGYEDFFSRRMTHTGNSVYTAEIPGFAVGSRGVEYFVGAGASQSFTRRPESGYLSSATIIPEGLTFKLPSGGSASGYRILSVPLDLDQPSVGDVLEDDLGSYDRTRWRVYGIRNRSLVESDGSNLTIGPGEAVWVVYRSENPLVDTGLGRTVVSDRAFRIPLAPEWNLVGSPFNFPIPLSHVSLASGNSGELWSYEGAWAVEDSGMVPFSGYAVFSASFDTLLINPEMSPEAAGGMAFQHPGPVKAEQRKRQLESFFSTPQGFDSPSRSANPRLDVYPNPLANSSTIAYTIEEPSTVTVEVYDLLGRRVATLMNKKSAAKSANVAWNDIDLPGGSYVVLLTANQQEVHRVVTVVR